jgi:hypothetical protein
VLLLFLKALAWKSETRRMRSPFQVLFECLMISPRELVSMDVVNDSPKCSENVMGMGVGSGKHIHEGGWSEERTGQILVVVEV